MGSITYFHPSVAPHTFASFHLDSVRMNQEDLKPAMIEARIGAAETTLRNMIAQL
jgi:hypothetical protein